jgi:hypothetical protein
MGIRLFFSRGSYFRLVALIAVLCACTAERNNPSDPGGSTYKPLTAPGSLSYTLADDSVKITWVDNNTHEAGYMVFAGPDTASMQCIDTLDSNTASYAQPFANPDTMFFSIGAYESKGLVVLSSALRVAILSPPHADAGPDQVVNLSSSVTLAGTGTGSAIEMAWQIGPDGLFETTPDGIKTFTSPAGVYAEYPCVFRVKNSDGRVVYDTCILTIGKDWEQVGGSPGNVLNLFEPLLYDMAINSEGNPYTVFSGIFSLLNCMRFNGTQWEQVGSAIGVVDNPPRISLIGNQPFIVFTDTIDHKAKATYYYPSLSSWQEYPGSSMLSCVGPGDCDIDVYNDMPFVAYVDSVNTVSAKKFINGYWASVGSQDFFKNANSNTIRIVTNSKGVPYICGLSLDGDVFCYSYTSAVWVLVGGIAAGKTTDFYRPSLAVSGDTCCISYSVSVSPGNFRICAKRSIGNGVWSVMDSVNASGGREIDIKLIRGVPYIAFSDINNQSQISVLRYFKGAWQNAGNPLVSPAWFTQSIRLETNGSQVFVAGVYNVWPFNLGVWKLR